ncbi:MAG: transaldolase [Verrucomicrobia bacterium]|nr:transaldolase [Verrucomicrobiota bacterium]
MNQLDQLRQFTVVVADTGDFASMKAYGPRDATTNPTLIYKAVQMDAYAHLLEKAAERADLEGGSPSNKVAAVTDHLLVLFGQEILKIVPGRVSTEVDARLSFDTSGTLEKARRIISLYEKAGVDRERVLIKIASTWEGLQAAGQLEQEGIHCNLTLLFSLAQAVVAAENNITLISPFVGRILDWYKKHTGKDFTANEDPGVESVRQIYNYYKHFGYATEVMGASFRNIGEIQELAGCDLLTISPNLLEELKQNEQPLPRLLSPENALHEQIHRLNLDEKGFRWHLNADPMATEKLAEVSDSLPSIPINFEAIIEKEIFA